jgi:hypothetical protein
LRPALSWTTTTGGSTSVVSADRNSHSGEIMCGEAAVPRSGPMCRRALSCRPRPRVCVT